MLSKLYAFSDRQDYIACIRTYTIFCMRFLTDITMYHAFSGRQDYLSYRGWNYERLDGSVRGEERYVRTYATTVSISAIRMHVTLCRHIM